jgi:hypothetical protein
VLIAEDEALMSWGSTKVFVYEKLPEPFEPSRGSHSLPFGDVVFIDAADFRLEDDEDYFSGKLTMDDFQHLLS